MDGVEVKVAAFPWWLACHLVANAKLVHFGEVLRDRDVDLATRVEGDEENSSRCYTAARELALVARVRSGAKGGEVRDYCADVFG